MDSLSILWKNRPRPPPKIHDVFIVDDEAQNNSSQNCLHDCQNLNSITFRAFLYTPLISIQLQSFPKVKTSLSLAVYYQVARWCEGYKDCDGWAQNFGAKIKNQPLRWLLRVTNNWGTRQPSSRRHTVSNQAMGCKCGGPERWALSSCMMV